MVQPAFDFDDQVVVVTGGSRGVGAGIVTAFLDAGANVVTCGRHEAEVDGAVFVAADIRKPAEAERVIAKAVEQWGRLDVLVNNAGGSPSVPAAEATPRFAQAIVDLNLLAPLWCAQSAHKVMALQDEGGAIVNVTSVSGLRPSPGASVYGAAKAGLINLTQTLAMEWAPTRAGQLREWRLAGHRSGRRLLRRARRRGQGGGHGSARSHGDARRRGAGLPVPGVAGGGRSSRGPTSCSTAVARCPPSSPRSASRQRRRAGCGGHRPRPRTNPGVARPA